MNRPLVSIVVPVFNAEEYLHQTLNCICNQDYENIEIIISDNASSDNTKNIILDYAKQDPRIKYYFHNENKGAAWNYNFTVEKSSGDYFKWAAYDDLFATNYISACVTQFELSPEAVLIYGKTLLLDEYNTFYAYYDDNLHLTLEHPHQRLYRLIEILARCNPVFGLMKRSTMLETNLIGSYISSDRVFLAEMVLRGHFIELPDYLFFRRLHSEISTSANKNNTELLNWFKTKNKTSLLSFLYKRFPALNLYLQNCISILKHDSELKEKRLCFSRLNKATFNSQKTKSNTLNQRIAKFNLEQLGQSYLNIVENINSGEFTQGLAKCNEILELNPWNPDLLHYRASIFLKKNSLDQAKTDIDKALLIKPLEASFNNTAGLIYKSLGNNDKAMQFYDKSLSIKPDYKEAQYNRDILLELKEQ